MFHHSSSRNHRSKGSNVKKILQVVVLLAVTCWLLYQVKHSREKKIEYAGNDEKKLSNGGEEISLGRKGDAGSENVIIIDTNALGSDEGTEFKQDESHHESSDLSSEEDKSKETSHNPELEDSKENNSDNGEKESTVEELADSHDNAGEETLRLPGERDGDSSSDQNENNNEGVDGTVVNNVEATMASEETTSVSADQAVSSENAGKENEQENGEAGNQEIVSVDDETPKGEGFGSDDENIQSLSETSVDNKIDHADGSDDDHARSSQDDAASTNDQINDVLLGGDSAEVNSDTSLQNGNGASKEGEVETRPGNASEVENTDNSSSGETKIDGESEKEIESSSSNGEVQQSSGTSSDVSVESQADKSSDAEGTMNINDEQETSSEAKNNEAVALQANNEDAKVETGSQRREAGEDGDSENNAHETNEEIGKSSEQSGVDDRRKDITAGNAGESQENQNGNSDDATVSDPGIEISGAGNEDHKFHEEGKSEATSNDEAITSSEVKEKIDSEDSANEIPAEETVHAEGSGDKAEAESTNDNNDTEEVKIEESSNVESKQDDNTNSSAEGEASEEKAVL